MIRTATIGALTMLMVACQMTYSANKSVVVKGSQPVAERLRVAAEVGKDLYENKMQTAVRERFNLSDQQARGLYVRWGTTNFKNVVGSTFPEEPVVTLNVGIQHHGEIKNADEIADFCATLAREALAARGLSGS